MDHSIPYLNNKVAEKLSGINRDKIKINEISDKNELIKKINEWSDKYEKTCSDAGLDLNNLKDFIIEYDWDTRFLWLISHANIINPQNNLTEIYENSIFINKLFEQKLLVVKASENVVRLLPPLIVNKNEIDEAISIIDKVCENF